MASGGGRMTSHQPVESKQGKKVFIHSLEFTRGFCIFWKITQKPVMYPPPLLLTYLTQSFMSLGLLHSTVALSSYVLGISNSDFSKA